MSETPGLAETPHGFSLLREAWRTALPPWRAFGPTVLYCLRTVAAMGIALYTSFSLQLLSPLSSVITVLIVANPVSGALVSKSMWRLLGTFIGAAAAVLLMAFFAQTPLLFYIFLSLGIAAACAAATLLRFFKAYGAVLAGYTIVIVCQPAFADPQDIFTNAISRVSAVSVGIASAALVFLLTRPRLPSRLSDATLQLIRAAAGILAEPGAGPVSAAAGSTLGSLPPAFYDRRAALLTQANGLHEVIEYAVADSAAIARQARRLRLGAAGLIGALTALHPLISWPARDDPMAEEARTAIASLGSFRLDQPEPVLDRLANVRDRLCEALDRTTGATPPDLDHLGAMEHAQDLLARLHESILHLTPLRDDATARASEPRLRLFLDWPTALRNGARGAIVTMLACLFWYVTEWPSGPVLLAYLVPASCLLSTNPSAARASVDFSIGTLLAIPASYVCETFLLPQIEGFPLLLASLAICLLPGIWLQFHPRLGLRAFGYIVFFNAMITVRNPGTFNDFGLINGWLAFIIGTAALAMVFRALLPPNHRNDVNRLVRSLARAVAHAGSTRRPPPRVVWENLQQQKVARLTQRLQLLGANRHHDLIDSALIAIEIGRDILRLRRLLADAVLEPAERQATDAVLTATGRVHRHPRETACAAREAAVLLAARPDPPPGLRRIAALLHEIAILVAATPEFLSSNQLVPLAD